MKKLNMDDLKPVSTPMSTAISLDPNENGEVVDQREYKSMIGSLIPHGDTAEHSVRRVPLCTLSGFPTLTSNSSSMNLQVPQTHS
jgi:hypothetical protein